MSRILDFSDGFESSQAPETGIVPATSLKTYANSAEFVTAKGSAATAGDLYLNTTDGQIHFYTGTEWKKIVVDKHKSKYDITETQPIDTVFTLQDSGKYVVGLNQLYVSLDGQLLAETVDYEEVGVLGETGTQIKMLISLEPGDTLLIRT